MSENLIIPNCFNVVHYIPNSFHPWDFIIVDHDIAAVFNIIDYAANVKGIQFEVFDQPWAPDDPVPSDAQLTKNAVDA